MVPGEIQDFMMGQVEIKPKPALEVQVEKIGVPAMDVEVEKLGMSGLVVEEEKIGMSGLVVEEEKIKPQQPGLVVEKEKIKLDFPASQKEAEEIQVELSSPNHKQEVFKNDDDEKEVTQPGGILVEQARFHVGHYIALIWGVWILVVAIVLLLQSIH